MKANLLGLVLAGLFCAFLDWSMTWPIFDGKRAEMVYSTMMFSIVVLIVLLSVVYGFLGKYLTKR